MTLKRLPAACAAAFLAFSTVATANPAAESSKESVSPEVSLHGDLLMQKAASTQVLGSRGTVTPSATLYGGFELAQPAVVYILVRGNSLGSLNITQNFLDLPRVRIYNSAGQDLIVDGTGRAGFNGCLSSNASDAPVINYYAARNAPVHSRDACLGAQFTAGVFTFSVTPSIPGTTTTTGQSVPSSGEVLFEVSFNP